MKLSANLEGKITLLCETSPANVLDYLIVHLHGCSERDVKVGLVDSLSTCVTVVNFRDVMRHLDVIFNINSSNGSGCSCREKNCDETLDGVRRK